MIKSKTNTTEVQNLSKYGSHTVSGTSYKSKHTMLRSADVQHLQSQFINSTTNWARKFQSHTF